MTARTLRWLTLFGLTGLATGCGDAASGGDATSADAAPTDATSVDATPTDATADTDGLVVCGELAVPTFAPTRHGADARFEAIGPRGFEDKSSGKVDGVLLDPADPVHAFYAVAGSRTGPESDGGIFYTADGGATWEARMTGMVDASGRTDGHVLALAAGPSGLPELFASTRLATYHSADGGRSWERLADPGTALVDLLAAGEDLWAAGDKGIYRFDPTAGFVQVRATEYRLWALAASPADGALYASGQGGHILRLDPGGEWEELTAVDGDADRVLVHPARPELLYVFAGGAFRVSSDRGATWERVELTADRLAGVQATAIGPANADGDARVYIGGYTLVSFPADGATAATAIWHGIDGPDIRRVLVVPGVGGADRCVVGSDQGIFVKDPCDQSEGQTFVSEPLGVGLVNSFAVSPDGQVLVMTPQDFDTPIASNDGGATWANTEYFGENGVVAIDPADPRLCFAMNGYFARSEDGCRTWVKIERKSAPFWAELDGVNNTKVAFDAHDASVMYVANDHLEPNREVEPEHEEGQEPPLGFAHLGVWRSQDAGRTFAKVDWQPAGFLLASTRGIAVSAVDGDHIVLTGCPTFTIEGDGAGNEQLTALGCGAVSVSFDRGATWVAANLPPSDVELDDGPDITGLAIGTAACDPRTATVLVTRRLSWTAVKVYRSVDGGQTFDAGTTLDTHGLGDLFVWPISGGVAFAPPSQGRIAVIATGTGAFRSVDDGATWSRLDRGDMITSSIYTDVAFDAAGRLYLGTWGEGIVRSPGPISELE